MKSIDNNKRYSIKVDRLSFGYQKKDTCFSSASFTLGCQEMAILISGGHLGKSTLIRILAGLENGYVGNIKLLNNSNSKLFNAFKNVVYLPEKPVFLENKSVLKNIEFAYKCLYENSNNLDYVVKTPKDFTNLENSNVSKLNAISRMKLEIERAKLKNIKLLLIDRSILDIESECNKRKVNFNENKESISIEYKKLINNSESAIVVAETYDDIKFYGADNFSVLYLYMGKIYKYNNLAEFENDIKEFDTLKFIPSRKNIVSKLELVNDKYYLFETNISNKKTFDFLLQENIKKRKNIDKNMKKYIKSGIYEKKCAEIEPLFKRKIPLNNKPELLNKLIKLNYKSGDYFISSYKINSNGKCSKFLDSDFMFFDCITHEKIVL